MDSAPDLADARSLHCLGKVVERGGWSAPRQWLCLQELLVLRSTQYRIARAHEPDIAQHATTRSLTRHQLGLEAVFGPESRQHGCGHQKFLIGSRSKRFISVAFQQDA